MKIFKINEIDWYMAKTLEEAIAQASEDTGLPLDEVTDNPYELSEEDMDRLMIINQLDEKLTFRQELERRMNLRSILVTQGLGGNAEFFASTEE